MGSHFRRESMVSASSATPSTSDAPADPDPDRDLDFPFPRLDADLDGRDLRHAAYDLFFAACRSGKARRTADAPAGNNPSPTAPAGTPKPLFAPSRIKTALGLKTHRRAHPKKGTSSSSSGSSSSTVRHKPPRTSAEVMRLQMAVSAQSDGRLRMAFTRILLDQTGRRAEKIVLPLELLRHLKPSDFADVHEYHAWQRRQLKMLEAGLLLHTAVPLDKANPSAARLHEIVLAGEKKPIDAIKNSDTARTLSNCVAALAWRAPGGATAEACHWADGFPLNLHLYLALLQSIFDKKDDSQVLEEVDELVELIKKTWPTLGIDKAVHNLCFAWVLFQQFVRTGQVEDELLSASLTLLAEVGDDAKRTEKDSLYASILSSTLTSMQGWAEKKLLDYHECFPKNVIGSIENVLPLALSAVKILDDEAVAGGGAPVDSTGNRVDYYIRSSLRNAFAKVLEAQNVSSAGEEEDGEGKVDYMSESLLQLMKETEELAVREKENFSPILKRWHSIAEGVAAITLHDCYGVLLKQYLNGVTVLTNEVVCVLQAAKKLEKVLIQMVEEATEEGEGGESALMKEVIPYEVDSIILDLTKSWTDERFSKVKDCINGAKDSETWNPTSKTEPHAQSVGDLMKLAKETVDDFLKIPAAVSEETEQELADGLENLLQDYITFVATCGSKANYIPTLPPLTRCNKDSKITRLWKKASPCKDQLNNGGTGDGQNPRPSTSRGTQRLYIRLNTLHYLQAHIQYLAKSLSLAPSPTKHRPAGGRRRFSNPPPSYFDSARASIQRAKQTVSEVAAYRLIFLDSNCVFYDGLYSGAVANSRIRPALRTMKQNLILLATILTDGAQPLAIKELAKASFEAFLMVLLAGGPTRSFLRSENDILAEDFSSLKRMLCTFGEGMATEAAVAREVAVVEGVIDLMGQSTEQLVEEFSVMACEASSLGLDGDNQRMLVPPATGRWNRNDPNTIFRVLCHRKDDAANRFLKTTFKLAKRR